jgi:hypothetical protein
MSTDQKSRLRRGLLILLLGLLLVAESVVAWASKSPPASPAEEDAHPDLGCQDFNVQCVDVCSSRVVPRVKDGRVTQLIAPEDQLVIVRAIGRGACLQTTVKCSSHSVTATNEGFPSPLPGTPPAPSGSVEEKVDSLVQGAAPASPPTTQSLDALRTSLNNEKRLAQGESNAWSQTLATAKDPTIRSNASGAQESAQSKAALADLGLVAASEADRLARQGHDLGLANVFYGIALALPDGAESAAEGCESVMDATAAHVEDRAKPLADALDGTDDPLVAAAVKVVNDQRMKTKGVLDALARSLRDPSAAALCKPALPIGPADMATLKGELTRLTTDAEAAIAAAGTLHVLVTEFRKTYSEWSTLTDCKITIPRGSDVREAAVDVEMTPASPAANDGGVGSPVPSKHAVVRFTIDHGRYYFDLVTVAGVVVDGQHSIVVAQRPGQPGATQIGLSPGNHPLFGIGVTVYPAGHRRQSYAVWDGYPRGWDILGLQAGVDVTTFNGPFPVVFTGIALEPVTGLSFGAGVAFEPMDKLINGYTIGDTPPANRNDYVNDKNVMARFYGSISIGYELFHTTGARLGTIGTN